VRGALLRLGASGPAVSHLPFRDPLPITGAKKLLSAQAACLSRAICLSIEGICAVPASPPAHLSATLRARIVLW